MFEVQPNIKCGLGRYVYLQTHLFKTLEHMVSLMLEVFLKCQTLGFDVFGFQERKGGKLEPRS